MPNTHITLLNHRGGLYDSGVPFTRARWLNIAGKYEDKMYSYGRCSVRRLTEIACTLVYLASKVIKIYQSSGSMPRRERQGHVRRGVGLLSGWEPRRDAFMYEIYLQNPSQPLYG